MATKMSVRQDVAARLDRLEACGPAIDWVKKAKATTHAQLWKKAQSEWKAWLLEKIGVSTAAFFKPLVLLALEKMSKHLEEDQLKEYKKLSKNPSNKKLKAFSDYMNDDIDSLQRYLWLLDSNKEEHPTDAQEMVYQLTDILGKGVVDKAMLKEWPTPPLQQFNKASAEPKE